MLRSVLDELTSESLGEVPDAVLVEDLAEIRAAIEGLEAQFVRRVAEADRRECGRSDGILSTTSLLVHRCGLAGSTAREKVRVARALQEMPHTAEAFTGGVLSYSKVRMLATAREANPDLFADHEAGLVEAVAPLTVRDARTATGHWRQAAHPEKATEDIEAMHVQRHLHVSETFAGAIHVEGMVDPVDGSYLTAAIDAVTSELARSDARAATEGQHAELRTAGQRRMDALTEICRQWLTNGTVESGGEKPHVSLIVDLDTLEKRAGRRCQTGSTVIDGESARMLACDAGVSRIITDGPSQPLDVGRRTRTIPPAIRTALAHRDGGCRFPACDRPPAWTDGHHITHWADGGPTSLDNLVLLCRRHHRLIHRSGFTVDHTHTFHRPDGTRIE